MVSTLCTLISIGMYVTVMAQHRIKIGLLFIDLIVPFRIYILSKDKNIDMLKSSFDNLFSEENPKAVYGVPNQDSTPGVVGK